MTRINEGSTRGGVKLTMEPRRGLLMCQGWKWLALLVVFVVATLAAKAQMAGTGAISGTVTDPTGAVIPDATVPS